MDFKIYFAVDIPKLWDILYILFNLEVYMELKIYLCTILFTINYLLLFQIQLLL